MVLKLTIGKTENDETTLENHNNTWVNSINLSTEVPFKKTHSERHGARWKENQHARTVGDFGDGKPCLALPRRTSTFR